MNTGKRIVMMAVLGLFALATPVFAAAYDGSCAFPNSVEIWDGGGSNATSESAAPQREVTATQLQEVSSTSTLAWDGGGSNAIPEYRSSGDFTTTEELMNSAPTVPWDGGGSNATSEPGVSETGC